MPKHNRTKGGAEDPRKSLLKKKTSWAIDVIGRGYTLGKRRENGLKNFEKLIS